MSQIHRLHRLCLALTTLLALLCCNPPAKATTYYVDPHGDNSTGLSLAQAFTTLQAGLNVANSGDTVLVSNATYSGNGNNDLTFSGKNIALHSATVYGSGRCVIDCQSAGPT